MGFVLSDQVKPVKASSARIYLRIFVTVFLLLAITIIGAVWAINSEAFTKFAYDYFVGKAEQESYKVETLGLAGSLREGITLKSVTLKKTSPSVVIRAENVAVKFDFHSLFSMAQIFVEGNCEKIEVSCNQPPQWLNSVPSFPEIGCFAHMPGNLHISKLNVEQIVFKPINDDQILLRVFKLALLGVGKGTLQNLSFACEGLFKKRQFLEGRFDGLLNQKNKKLEGRLNACLAGEKFSSELVIAQKKRKFEISGHVAEGALNVTVLSQWLIPLWQDAFPFGFDGIIKIGGSWLYSENVGFLGNLSGDFEKVRMVAQGLFITVFELNGNWKLFDGSLEISDSGSFFAGFPAKLSGKIDAVFDSSRSWNLNFKSDRIVMEKFFDELPWGIKFGMGIPSMKGNSIFNLQLRGTGPDISATLKTGGTKIEKDSALHSIAGYVAYKMGNGKLGEWTTNFECLSEKGVPGIFKRFSNNGEYLSSALDKIGPLSFAWAGKGNSLDNLSISGGIKSEKAQVALFNGSFKDGNGQFVTSLTGELSAPPIFRANNLSFLQLLLAY